MDSTAFARKFRELNHLAAELEHLTRLASERRARWAAAVRPGPAPAGPVITAHDGWLGSTPPPTAAERQARRLAADAELKATLAALAKLGEAQPQPAPRPADPVLHAISLIAECHGNHSEIARRVAVPRQSMMAGKKWTPYLLRLDQYRKSGRIGG